MRCTGAVVNSFLFEDFGQFIEGLGRVGVGIELV